MTDWRGLDTQGLVARLRTARARRRPLEEDARTTAFRWVHAEADGVPGVTVDHFAGVAVMSLYETLTADEEARLVDAAVTALEPDVLFLKRRPREARVVANTQRDALAPESPAFGALPLGQRVAKENGLSFLIRPAQGLSVGLYLDMRDTRAWVQAQARGESVLNCFAYTCGFGVAAHAGGAARAVNVDLSRKVLDWGEENLRQNGVEPQRQDHLAGDVFDWLGRMAKKEQRFSLVVLDPPGFSTAKKQKQAFSAASHYDRLAQAAARVTERGGRVVSCCNVAQLSGARFERMLETGFARAGRRARPLLSMGASPLDFPRLSPADEGALKVRVHALD